MKEIYVNKSWSEVSDSIFRSYAGPRRINGKPYVGPVYYYLSDSKYKAPRQINEQEKNSVLDNE